MCVSSCAFRVSYHCFVCAWLRNMYLPNRNARNKNDLGTQHHDETLLDWQVAMFVRPGTESMVLHGSRLESGDSVAVFRCEKPPPDIGSLVPTSSPGCEQINEGVWMILVKCFYDLFMYFWGWPIRRNCWWNPGGLTTQNRRLGVWEDAVYHQGTKEKTRETNPHEEWVSHGSMWGALQMGDPQVTIGFNTEMV